MWVMTANDGGDETSIQDEAARWAARIADEFDALKRYARRLASSVHDAEDLAQECVLIALRARGRWRGEGPLRAWLFAILRNEHRRVLRQRARGPSVDVEALHDDALGAISEAPDPMMWRRLSQALRRLPDDQRQTLMLVAGQGRSYAEVALMTGAPIGTVMSRMYRARAALRRHMGAEAAKTPHDRGSTGAKPSNKNF